MKIPKYITHPTLIALISATLMYSMWLSTPSASQIQQTQSAPASDGTDSSNTKNLLDQNNLHQITELLPEGFVILDGIDKKLQINNDRFKKLTQEQADKLKDFFVGKFVKIEDAKNILALELPLNLYEPGCFSADQNVAALSKQCPLVLQP